MRAPTVRTDASVSDVTSWDASTDAATFASESATRAPRDDTRMPERHSTAATPPRPVWAGRWLATDIAGGWYAMPLPNVQEVVVPGHIVRLRGAAPEILGAMSLRGRVLPVIDLGLWLGTQATRAGDDARIVVLKRDDELVGVLVNRVVGVHTLAPDDVVPAPPMPARSVLAVATGFEAPIHLLDPSPFFG